MSLDDEDFGGALDVFVTEARELVQDVEEGILRLEETPVEAESVNALFRAIHTLKGSSGLFGLDHMVQFTHVIETLLDLVRQGELAVTPDLVSALLPCGDHILNLVEAIAHGRAEATPGELSTGALLLMNLRVAAHGLLRPLWPAYGALLRESPFCRAMMDFMR